MHRNNKNFHTSGKISCEHFEQEKCIYQGPGRLRNSMNAEMTEIIFMAQCGIDYYEGGVGFCSGKA